MLLQAQGHHHQETNVRLSKYYFDNLILLNEHIGYHDNVEMQVTRLSFERKENRSKRRKPGKTSCGVGWVRQSCVAERRRQCEVIL